LGRVRTGVALVVAVALVAAGCGTGGKATAQADQQNGQALFKSKCAGCHVLSAAGAAGTVGPSLDAAFAHDLDQGMKESTIRNVVLVQIRQPAPPMPKKLVTGQDAQDVAAYVAAVAGQSGAEATPPSELGTDGQTIFKAECASCHTLKAAGASGTVGPNLDQAAPPVDRVRTQVENGGGVMPAFKGTLGDEQIQAVAQYVADNAGK